MDDPETCESFEESCELSSEEIDALVTVDEESGHAQQAARVVDATRREHGQGPLDFEELEERQARLVGPHRRAAADCHECGNNWRASPN